MPSLPSASTTVADEGDRVALLQDDTAFTAAPDPALERWLVAVRRQAGVPCAVLSLTAGARQFFRLAVGALGSTARACEIAAGESLEDYLRGPASTCTLGPGGAYAEARILVAGKPVGCLGMADPGRTTWSVDELAVLGDAAIGIAAELDRRLARAQVERVHHLVASHNRVHDMIDAGVPLREVLVEVCHIIERYDRSLIPRYCCAIRCRIRCTQASGHPCPGNTSHPSTERRLARVSAPVARPPGSANSPSPRI